MKFPKWRNKSDSPFSVGSQTDVGVTRSENQDACGVFSDGSDNEKLERLFVVADGMGGHEHGREASSMAVDVLKNSFFDGSSDETDQRLLRAFKLANETIYDHSQRFGEGTAMGTTCTAMAICNDRFWIAHVGDSRTYRIDDDGMVQITEDHTFINELLREGVLSEEAALTDPRRHNLVKAMGIGPYVDPDVFEIPKPDSGTRFLICSDGLAVVPADTIASVVKSGDVQTACDELIRRANEQGGPDNITVVVVEPS